MRPPFVIPFKITSARLTAPELGGILRHLGVGGDHADCLGYLNFQINGSQINKILSFSKYIVWGAPESLQCNLDDPQSLITFLWNQLLLWLRQPQMHQFSATLWTMRPLCLTLNQCCQRYCAHRAFVFFLFFLSTDVFMATQNKRMTHMCMLFWVTAIAYSLTSLQWGWMKPEISLLQPHITLAAPTKFQWASHPPVDQGQHS